MLLVITGMTCTGKDSVVKGLVARGYAKRIVSHTTRPKREGEEDGVDYFFHPNDYEVKKDETFCLKKYTVANGDTWQYWFEDSQIKDALEDKENWYVCIADASGASSLAGMIKEQGHDSGLVVKLWVNTETMLKRYYEREKKNSNPDYAEVIRRILSDIEQFEEYRLGTKEDVYIINNERWSVDETVEYIHNEMTLPDFLRVFN